MASLNPQIYYDTESNHGSYVYVSLESIVDDFIDTYTGNGSIIGKANRRKIVRHAKQGIKQFTINALRDFKAAELELGDTLDIILPPDYVSYVRISYVNPSTGELMVLSENRNSVMGTAYLQDHDANILFDNDGFVLEGTTYYDQLNDTITQRNFVSGIDIESQETDFQLDPTKNINGTFQINTRQGRIHFSSDSASRIIMLEYVSDGLEFTNEADIKVSKLAEVAILNYINYNMMFSDAGITEYTKERARKAMNAEYTNAKIKMMDIRIADTMLVLNAKRQYLR
jgi:hypothetical protein